MKDASTDPLRRSAWVRVRDSGPGIADSDQERIFEPFERATSVETARRPEGTGLGLTISRRLAREMGGDVTVESVLGLGACFTLQLPAGEATIGRVPPGRDAESEPSGG